ncbi:hypothetical protein [Pseudonocardia broussonetiae]|uniref:Lipoprotein n=1 Tax=Pseudonocardia broussonetiae TaxID=2736640 RepID=A0A6M6J9Q0_9PSEU|nr:hypothetical protein [Pseudonocardia broussonetiae]QJY44574.1 hypothetical protein HOP40_00940 [Pseudonocardia broussonetiae]
MDGRTRSALVAAAMLVAVAAGGCASAQRPEVERVAGEFAAAGPEARCALLAPAVVAVLDAQDGCETGVAQVPAGSSDVVGTEVWGDDAQVRLPGDTLFLTRTATGWKVVAAGCRPAAEGPYVCAVEAG